MTSRRGRARRGRAWRPDADFHVSERHDLQEEPKLLNDGQRSVSQHLIPNEKQDTPLIPLLGTLSRSQPSTTISSMNKPEENSNRRPR